MKDKSGKKTIKKSTKTNQNQLELTQLFYDSRYKIE
jgi:hypothetical protein